MHEQNGVHHHRDLPHSACGGEAPLKNIQGKGKLLLPQVLMIATSRDKSGEV